MNKNMKRCRNRVFLCLSAVCLVLQMWDNYRFSWLSSFHNIKTRPLNFKQMLLFPIKLCPNWIRFWCVDPTTCPSLKWDRRRAANMTICNWNVLCSTAHYCVIPFIPVYLCFKKPPHCNYREQPFGNHKLNCHSCGVGELLYLNLARERFVE